MTNVMILTLQSSTVLFYVVITDSQYKGAYAVFFKEKINLVMRNSNNRF
jgi:hypothetical protein